MKRIFFICVGIFITLSINLFGAFGGGSGTESDPYLISSKEHLEELSDSVCSRNPFFLNLIA